MSKALSLHLRGLTKNLGISTYTLVLMDQHLELDTKFTYFNLMRAINEKGKCVITEEFLDKIVRPVLKRDFETVLEELRNQGYIEFELSEDDGSYFVDFQWGIKPFGR